MRMYKTRRVRQEILQSIVCNKCGTIHISDLGDIEPNTMRVVYHAGYGSSLDGELHEFDICETCYLEFSKSFKVPVDIFKEPL